MTRLALAALTFQTAAAAPAPAQPAESATVGTIAAPAACRAVDVDAGADTLGWTAPLEAAVSVDVCARAGGTVAEVRVREGDRVAAGDTLVGLERGDLDLAMARALLAYQRQQAYLERATQLHRQGGLSTQQLETVRYEADSARLRLAQAEADLGRTVARAPMAGQVAECAARVGRTVTAGEVLAVIIDPTDLAADVFVPAAQLEQVSLRQAVRARLQPNAPGAANEGTMAGAAAAAVPGPALAGQVVHISPVIDPRTGQGRVRLLFPGAGQRCRPGTLVRVELVGR